MNIVDLRPSFYCLYLKNRYGEEERFFQYDIRPDSSLRQLHLFESKEALYRWIEQEKEMMALGTHKIYERFYPKKMFLTEFSKLMKEDETIDSLSVIDNNGVRKLYFRSDLGPDFNELPVSNRKLYPKEPIYIINRQKMLDHSIILQKDSYFVVYPEVATPIFSIGILEWAEDLISRVSDQGYSIEQTNLFDIYRRTTLEEKYTGFFILSREEAPHYILRQNDLKRIVEGTWNVN